MLSILHGPTMRASYLMYSAKHPWAVEVITRHKAALGEWVEVATGLSRPFRHLERLVVGVEEVKQHLGDSHVGRGRLRGA